MMKSLQDNINFSLMSRLLSQDAAGLSERSEMLTGSARFNSNAFYESIRQDMENLLNTKKRCLSWPQQYQELNQSLFDYGLPDFIRKNLDASESREEFCLLIASTIERYDPRFKEVTVKFEKSSNPEDEELHFYIEATILLGHQSDRVVFDAVFSMDAQKFLLRQRTL